MRPRPRTPTFPRKATAIRSAPVRGPNGCRTAGAGGGASGRRGPWPGLPDRPVEVARGDLVASVTATGNAAAVAQSRVSFPSAGRVRAVLVAVGDGSIRRYRWRPAPRPPSQTWGTFQRNHAHAIWAADLLTVQTLTFRTLYVLVFITHGRRELVHVAVTARPTAAWVWRQLIEATAWGRRPTYLIRDRDRVYGGDFAARAKALGIQTLLTPFRAPKANAIAERVVRTLRNDCLDHVLVLNEQHLRLVLAEYVAYYNTERPHRSLALAPPLPASRGTTVSCARRFAPSCPAYRNLGLWAGTAGRLSCPPGEEPGDAHERIMEATTNTLPNPATAAIWPETKEPVMTPASVNAQNVAIAPPRSAGPARSIASAWSAGRAIPKPTPTATPARMERLAARGRRHQAYPGRGHEHAGTIAANRPRRRSALH